MYREKKTDTSRMKKRDLKNIPRRSEILLIMKCAAKLSSETVKVKYIILHCYVNIK